MNVTKLSTKGFKKTYSDVKTVNIFSLFCPDVKSLLTYPNNKKADFLNDDLLQTCMVHIMPKATITRCDLSPRFFCIDATLLCEFESDKI